MGTTGPILAAGVVTVRRRQQADGRKADEVLLVHRPRYDDWSFPKGKLERFEHATAAAVREVFEEAGLEVRLGPSLGVQTYPLESGGNRLKQVQYWVGHPRHATSGEPSFTPNREVDERRWVTLDKARELLTYDYDVDLLGKLSGPMRKSSPLIILRHTKARSRRGWKGDDRRRTLTSTGNFQAEQLVPLLAAYGAEHLISSSSTRCRDTIGPYADVTGFDVRSVDSLSEEDATSAGVHALVAEALGRRVPTVICSHRPVLPWVFEALHLEPRPLDPGAFLVIHHRRGKQVDVEEHRAPSGR